MRTNLFGITNIKIKHFVIVENDYTSINEFLKKHDGNIIDIQYERNEMDFKRGSFRVRGDIAALHPLCSFAAVVVVVVVSASVVVVVVTTGGMNVGSVPSGSSITL